MDLSNAKVHDCIAAEKGKCMIAYSLTGLPAAAEKRVVHGLGPDIGPRILVIKMLLKTVYHYFVLLPCFLPYHFYVEQDIVISL